MLHSMTRDCSCLVSAESEKAVEMYERPVRESGSTTLADSRALQCGEETPQAQPWAQRVGDFQRGVYVDCFQLFAAGHRPLSSHVGILSEVGGQSWCSRLVRR